MANHKLLVDKPYVEIGGIKWATMNIGANSETDLGLYFQWGDTAGYTSDQCGSGSTANKKPFTWEDCVLHDGTSSYGGGSFTKYQRNDEKYVLEETDDAAVANWGGKWRIPTKEEFSELTGATTSAWTTSYNGSGVPGIILTDKTNSSKKLFFPATGWCSSGKYTNPGTSGDYASSSLQDTNGPLDTSAIYCIWTFFFTQSGASLSSNNARRSGLPIRPVWDDSK